jgi:HK97 gp10 family phage protein
MAEQIRIEGLRELLETLKSLPKEIGSKGGGPIRVALLRAAKLMQEEAQARAPQDTGRLRRNIIAFSDRNPRASGVTEQYGITFRRGKRRGQKWASYLTKGGGENDAYYGRFVEFGTSRQPAKPFLRPAFETKKIEAAFLFRNEMARAIELAVKKLQRGQFRGR